MLAIGAIVALGLTGVNLLLLRFVRSFGKIPERMAEHNERMAEHNRVNVEIHNTNLMILEQHQQMLEDIRHLKSGEAA